LVLRLKKMVQSASVGVLSAKRRVEKEVLELLIDGLNSGELTVDKAREAARETLETLEKLDTHEETLAEFYKSLSEKYPIFAELYDRVKSDVVKAKEVSAYRQAIAAIHTGQMEKAHSIAQGAIVATAHESGNAN